MRFIGRAAYGFLLFALTLALLAYGGWRLQQSLTSVADEGRTRPDRERSFTVDVQTVKMSAIKPSFEYFGEVHAWRSLEIRATRSGEVVDLAPVFKDGARVPKGQLLYSIESAVAANSVETSRLSLEQAQADLEESIAARQLSENDVKIVERQLEIEQAELFRQRGLLDKGLVSQSAVEKAEQAVAGMRQSLSAKKQSLLAARMRSDSTALAVNRASITVEDARKGLAESDVYAPFDGVLAQISATLGSRVGANEKLGMLIDPGSLEVSFRVPDAQIARLLDEQGTGLMDLAVTVSLSLGARSISMHGRLDRIAATVDASRGGRMLFARLDPDNQTIIRPGDLVSVKVEQKPIENVVSLAARSLRTDSTVLVVAADQRLESRPVAVVHRQDNQVLVNGLVEGEFVVINPQPQLGVGVKVAVNDAGRVDKNAVSTADSLKPDDRGTDGELIDIEPDRRSRLIAAVEANTRIPSDRRESILKALQQDQVPRRMIDRIESRLGTK